MRCVSQGWSPTTGARQYRARTRRPEVSTMFFFFSNRLGCLGSVLLSVFVTAVLFVLLSR